MSRGVFLRAVPVRFVLLALALSACLTGSLALCGRASAATYAPVAAYSFDEGTGGTVADLSGHEHTATIHGAKWTPKGRYGGAMEFTATEETYVSIPASAGLDNDEEVTVEAWVRPTVTSPNYGEIAMKEREGNPAYTWTLDLHETEPAGYFMRTEEGSVAGGPGSMPLYRWTHVAMTDDGAHNRLYVNGELVDTEPAIPFDGHGEIRIGGNSIFGQYFDGRIDELRIYERALTGAEVAADMETPLQTPKKTPVAEYSFDQDPGEGGTVEDLAGEHDATIEGAEWVEHGRYGGAMKFDGESMLTIPPSEELNLTEEFTLEAWVRPEAGCTFGQIFVKEDAEEAHGAYILSKHDSKLGAWLGVPGVEEESPSGTLEIGAWQHIALTFDGSKATLYVDGAVVGTAPVAEILSTSGALRIGGSHVESHGGNFIGRIDEVRIYNRALDTAEVDSDMESPIQTPKKGTIAAYTFEAGEGGTVEDVSGNEHEGMIEGATWTSAGKYGDALEFKGSETECVSIEPSPTLALGEEFTVDLWVKRHGTAGRSPLVYMEDKGTFTYSLGLSLTETGRAKAYLSDGSGGSWKVFSPTAIDSNVWTHLTLTYDGGQVRLYINGEVVAERALVGLNLTSEGPLQFGCASLNHQGFDGRIDEVRLYQRALSTAEVNIVPESRVASCDAASSETVGDAFGLRKPLPGGGYAVVYHLAGGRTIELPMPPEGFDPLAASNAELEEYGLPPRPSELMAVAEWEARMAGYQSVEPEITGLCETALRTDSTLEGSKIEEEGEEEKAGEGRTSPIWSGFVAVDRTNPNRFVGVEGIYTQPLNFPETSCPEAREVSWVGIGGFHAPGLIQAGTEIATPSGELFAWYEFLNGGRGINITKIPELTGHIVAGDEVSVSVRYISSSKKGPLAVYYVSTRHGEGGSPFGRPVVEPLPNGPLFYNGHTAEWIDERPTYGKATPLEYFEPIPWRHMRAIEPPNHEVKPGELPRKRLQMKEEGTARLAEASHLGPNKDGFKDTWYRCLP